MASATYFALNNVWTNLAGTISGSPGSGATWPGGVGVPARTVFGCSAKSPDNNNPDPLLDPYRNKSKPDFFDFLQTEYGNLIGVTDPIKAFHGYDGGFPSNFGNHECNMVLSRTSEGQPLIAAVNVKGSDSAMVAGSLNSTVINFVQSCPTNRTTYFIFNHERDNDTDFVANPASVGATHRDAMARFCKLVIDNRGARPVVPGCCYTNWGISSNNGANYRAHLDWSGEATALGVDLDEVIYTVDGYDTEPIQLGGAANLYNSTEPWVRANGFSRYAVSEGGCKSHTTADRNLTAAWMRECADLAIAKRFEYYLWFNSGVGNRAGPEGWYIYGTANKTQFARICANDYPAVIV